jgi:integrase
LAGTDLGGDLEVNQSRGRPGANEEGWTWPVDVSRYDQNDSLTPDEFAELSAYVRRFENHNSNHPQRFHTAMVRLALPINNVFDLSRLRPEMRGRAIYYLFREMHRRNRSFWGWSPEEWVETIRRAVHFRQHYMAIAYLLCDFTDFHAVTEKIFVQVKFAAKIFGTQAVDLAIGRVRKTLAEWGYGKFRLKQGVPRTVSEALLISRSPHLEDLTNEVLETMRQRNAFVKNNACTLALSQVLVSWGVIKSPLSIHFRGRRADLPEILAKVPSDWARWCRYWHDTSTVAPKTRAMSYYVLLNVGRWLAIEHPDMTAPEHWTHSFASESVGVIDRMKCGDGTEKGGTWFAHRKGKPLSASTKARRISILRTFFLDLQEWGAIPRRFDPRRCLRTPKTMLALLGPKPRPLADDVWAKLLWAGLNLTVKDLPTSYFQERNGPKTPWYPIEIVRALTIVWLFAGLRRDEILRLRVGCVRWQPNATVVLGAEDVLPKDAVCFLDIPVSKTAAAFAKPVDRVVGEAIAAWERMRPIQPKVLDEKTSELVDCLFMYRAKRVGPNYLNKILIPKLCRKAGIPTTDCRGSITAHRARSTIASQLYNAKEPMSLFELQQWLGHRNLRSTQHYANITPTKLAKAYSDAGYFGRNLRAVDVLINQDVVKRGLATQEPWKFYDLGHGYCTYDFFDQCPHRMACAKCSFYRPKGSTEAQLLEGRNNLLRMRQEIPLGEAELAAVEDGITAMEKLIVQLADVPTPAGPTPRQLRGHESHEPHLG